MDTAYTYQSGSNKLLQTDATTQTVYYSYDSDGNTLSTTTGQAGTTTGSTVDYAYNHNGQRIKKVVDNGASTATTVFHYDLFGNIIAETDGTGNPKCAYIYLNGMLLVKVDGNSTSESIYYYHKDHLGTPQKLTNTNGIVVWAADYDPFGTATVSAGSTIENNMRFPGQYYDSETGLHYNYHRYYDPGTGRYLTPDPIGLAGGINLYAYVSNNPVNVIDPYGLESFPFQGYTSPVAINAATTPNGGYYPYSAEAINTNSEALIELTKPLKPVGDWFKNKAHTSAILGSAITGAKAGAETKNPYAGIIVGGTSLGASCVGCHTAHEILFPEPEDVAPDDKGSPCE